MAAAGSFDDTAGEQEFEAVQAQLERAANQAAQSAQSLAGATKQGPSGMAAAANHIVGAAGDAVRDAARQTAAQMGDARAQARLLNAAHDVAIAAQSAVTAAKKAYTGVDQSALQPAVQDVQAKVAALVKVTIIIALS